jgi:glycosyltransferase involved in cell wall biosynthesis
MPEKDLAQRRLKVLVVAAAAHPEKGSEPGLGWSWIEALSKYHDLWVITGEREENREAINQRFNEVAGLCKRLQIFFIPRPDGPFIERVIPLIYYRLYRQWHQQAFQFAMTLDKEICFDLFHQLNMTGFREPGYLWKFNRPFVWGPVGGTANVPLRFASILGSREFLYHLAKVTVNNLQLRFHKRVKTALKRVDGFVTSTSDTRDAFLRIHHKDSAVLADTGPPLQSKFLHTDHDKASSNELRLSWSGLHISRKALPLLLHAVAKLPTGTKWHLDIIGEGPMTSSWRKLGRKLGIDDRCTWHGWLSKHDANRIVSQSDIFVFPSLHEGMPTVVMEALSMGVPVICLDHCGQADVVTQDCGIKIPVTNPRKAIHDFTAAIDNLSKNPDEIDRLSKGALKRVEKFTWDKKAQAMLHVYEQAIVKWEARQQSPIYRNPA